MKKSISILVLFLILISCKTTQKNQVVLQEIKSEPELPVSETPYFKANGNEPFWDITISDKEIVFKSLVPEFESFNAPHVEPITAMDANVKMYRLATESGKMKIEISQQECVNTMSGDKSLYVVKVELEKGQEKVMKTFDGCGNYITNSNLYDIWALEQMNGKKVSLTDFMSNVPQLEINNSTNRFLGFAGCNQINGAIFSERNGLRFTKVASTMMACQPANKEGEFLKALQAATSYTVVNLRLTLSNPSGVLLVFKKVD